jgi:hypothetical protein
MYKNFIILANIVTLLFFSFVGNDVVITMNAPSEVVAGTDFTIEVTIKKGGVKDFSRFQQDLPLGLTASITSPEDAQKGEFRFQDNKVKILWYKGGLPDGEEFTIKYKVTVAPDYIGTILIGGQFAYLDENERKVSEIEPQQIFIKAGELTGANPKEYKPEDFNNVASSAGGGEVTCYRQKPYLNEKGEIIVNLQVNKGSNNKYGKIEEKIPEGFVAAVNTDRSDVIFSFKEQTAKMLWLTLPAQPTFVVSYKLKPTAEKTIDDLLLNGSFSYVSNDVTIPIDIIQKDDVTYSPSTQLVAQNTDGNKTNGTSNQNSNSQTNNTQATNNQGAKNNNASNNSDLANNQKSNNQKSNSGKTNSGKGTNTNSSKFNDFESNIIPDPETGVKYKVQIGAYKRRLGASYFKTVNVDEQVVMDVHNGLHKFLVGKHEEYKEARDHRIKIWDKTTIDDAFVTAYNNGNRITVQEALMITKQNWVK